MTTKHKLRATLPHGPKDMGAEVDVEIAFTFLPGGKPSFDDPGWGAEVEFLGCAALSNGVPFTYDGEFADLKQNCLESLAQAWLESDEGRAAALAEVAAELEDARAFVATLRRDSQ